MASSGGSTSNATSSSNGSLPATTTTTTSSHHQLVQHYQEGPTSPTSSCASDVADSSVPQWKRELIQRRRQQQQAAVRSPSATTTLSTGSGGAKTATAAATTDSPPLGIATTPSTPGDCDAPVSSSATTSSSVLNNSGSSSSSSNNSSDMRLEAADVVVVAGSEPGDNRAKCIRSSSKEVLDLVELAKMRNTSSTTTGSSNNGSGKQEDCESDSSEELQYGPGIVHKLRSKYLNMTLREMNKNRASVQCFRRAASLEDLLDHEESPEKTRRYTKKNVTGAAAKVERYRNAARGNESMKRARSVETLMRYNSAPEDSTSQSPASRFASNIFKQENDHIILVDRTSVKIESRLMDKDRLMKPPINKPKRIKPVLAETERPPPDLVKTTMRIFECSSIKKLKPKGEVAVKIATFKTINDTFKAQNQKKIIPKPPLQPKPFVNGNSKMNTSPRKIVLTRKPTAELIEQNNQELYHNDGVITDPIVQSVSSVVSKFQQIEKSYSPSSSPEPMFNKIKFSPAPSPEPSALKAKVSSLDLKSPTITPTPSPRTSPPKVQSPLSPKTETVKTPSTVTQKLVTNSSPVSAKPEAPKPPVSPETHQPDDFEKDKDEPSEEQVEETTVEINNQNTETINEVSKLSDSISSIDSTVLVESFEELVEVVDSPRTVSKSALDNISKAGMTVQFSFNDQPSAKSYLPRSASTPQPITDKSFESEIESPKTPEAKSKSCSLDLQCVPATSEIISSPESPKERVQAEYVEEIIIQKEEPVVDVGSSKPIGAISSLSSTLIRSSTITSYPQNESKTLKSQRSLDSSSPPQKQIGIIRPLVSTKTQLPQQNLSNREIEKNLINRVKSIEQPTKVVVSLKSAEEIQPVKKNNSGSGGLWDSKPWNQQNNTMVFNFSNRKDVPDYIENDGLIIKRKRDKPRQSSTDNNSSVITSSDDNVHLSEDWDPDLSIGPPSPCDVSFFNDNVLINGRSNLSRTPRNHKHRIQFDDTATRTFEYPSEASMLEAEGSSTSVDGETSASGEAAAAAAGGAAAAAAAAAAVSTSTRGGPSGTLPSLLGGGGLASYTPSKVDLASEGFELGVTRATVSTLASPQSATTPPPQQPQQPSESEVDYLKPSQDPGTWGQETAADMLY